MNTEAFSVCVSQNKSFSYMNFTSLRNVEKEVVGSTPHPLEMPKIFQANVTILLKQFKIFSRLLRVRESSLIHCNSVCPSITRMDQ